MHGYPHCRSHSCHCSFHSFNPDRAERSRNNDDVRAVHEHLLRVVVPRFSKRLHPQSKSRATRQEVPPNKGLAQYNAHGAICRVCSRELKHRASWAAVYSRRGKKLFLAPEVCIWCSEGTSEVRSLTPPRHLHGSDTRQTRMSKRCKQLLRACWREYTSVLPGCALAMHMHRAGLNMRLLGHVSRHAPDASARRRLAVEMAARTLKNVLRRHLRRTLERQSSHHSRVAVTEPFRLQLTHLLNSALVA